MSPMNKKGIRIKINRKFNDILCILKDWNI